MKINELREGIFDTIKQGTQSALDQAQNFPQKLALMRKSTAINNIADVAVRAWTKKVNTLTTVNNGVPLDDRKYKEQLTLWVDRNLIGGLTRADLPREARRTIDDQVNKIAQNRTNPNQWKESFKDVVASGAVLTASPPPPPPPPGGDKCKDTRKGGGNSYFVCGNEVKPGDTGYDEIKKMIDRPRP
jgi:hypothetical protein